ncbi:nuclear transport factor 2 family protein [Rathayibacter sp. YIM 133350]|uniref:nuclear transport factor 2 family protein n=1 Tax=Rathayibacter sp. YIM 133350 TaxID=3131992 RepID=UPI00307EADD9
MTVPNPTTFSTEWCDAWNAHDLDRLLSHFSESVVFRSPVGAQVIPGSEGVFRGKAAVREYWERGLALIPDLRFEVVSVYAGIDTIVIVYRNQKGALVSEVLIFDEDGLVVDGRGTYLRADQNPAGLNRH